MFSQQSGLLLISQGDLQRIHRWIRTAIEHKLVELDLVLWTENDEDDISFSIPQSLFVCKSLVVLKVNSWLVTYEL